MAEKKKNVKWEKKRKEKKGPKGKNTMMLTK